MNESIPPVFRSALDEPVPPVPVEPSPERGGDDGRCFCFEAPLIVWPHGGVSASPFGTLLVGWFFVATALSLWSFAQPFALAIASGAVTFGAFFLLGAAVCWLWDRWRAKGRS